jgi:hypothetical protein
MLTVVCAAAIPVTIACGSNTVDPVSPSSTPQCRGATGSTGPGSVACNACIENKCGSDVSPATSACGAYFRCYEGCACLDNGCVNGCTSKIDAACQLGGAALLTCEMSNCTSQCTAHTPADSGPADAASG